MIANGLRLTASFGERDHVGGRLLADALIELYASHGVRTSILLRAIEGFAVERRLASERLLTLSEDLPLVAFAVDTVPRIEALADAARALNRDGAVTLEPTQLLSGAATAAELASGAEAVTDALRLTVYVGRQERAGARAAYISVVDCLHRHGVAGACVLLGLDGTAGGVRQRARFLAANADVPLMIQSVGESSTIIAALAEIASLLREPAATLELVRLCKRDGVMLAAPHQPRPATGAGPARWQRLTVYASERTRYQREPLHSALVRRLREEGAASAAALRGQWGYHGEHRPHGEAFWSLQRHVPVLTTLADTQANMPRWFAIVDELTRESGLVTSELLPAPVSITG